MITLTREEAQQVTDRELIAQAIVALEYHTYQTRPIPNTNLAIEALRARLVQPEPEPEHVATIGNWGKVIWEEGVYPQLNDKLYTAPSQREWQGLTDEEICTTWNESPRIELWVNAFARAIEAKLKEKNT